LRRNSIDAIPKRRIKRNTFNSQYPLSISIAMKDEKKKVSIRDILDGGGEQFPRCSYGHGQTNKSNVI
jgi:HSP90 family molecular chaperone